MNKINWIFVLLVSVAGMIFSLSFVETYIFVYYPNYGILEVTLGLVVFLICFITCVYSFVKSKS